MSKTATKSKSPASAAPKRWSKTAVARAAAKRGLRRLKKGEYAVGSSHFLEGTDGSLREVQVVSQDGAGEATTVTVGYDNGGGDAHFWKLSLHEAAEMLTPAAGQKVAETLINAINSPSPPEEVVEEAYEVGVDPGAGDDEGIVVKVDAASQAETLTQAREELGDQRLGIWRPSWETLTQECVQVRLSVRYWRARKTLKLDDLGLQGVTPEFAAFASEFLALGQQKLQPARLIKELHSIDERARQIVREFGFKSPWGGALVPRRAYKNMREELVRLQNRFNVCTANILQSLEAWKGSVKTSYRTMALAQLRVKAMQEGAIPDLALLTPEQELLVERFVADVMAHIPSREELEKAYAFDWIPTLIEAPHALGKELDAAILEERVAAAKERLAGITDEIERRKEFAELRDLEVRLAAERALSYDLQVRAKEALQQEVEDLLSGVSTELCSLFDTAAKELRAWLVTDKRPSNAHVEKLRKLVEKARMLNVGDNAETNRMAEACGEIAAQLAKCVDPKAKKGDDAWKATRDSVRAELLNVRLVATAALDTLGGRGRGDEDDTDLSVLLAPQAYGENVRQARANLGLADLEIEAPTKERQARSL